jgi:protease I
MGGNGSQRGKIACVMGSGFEDSEFRVPVERLRAAGYEVEVVGTERCQTIVGKNKKEEVRVDRSIDDADPAEYEGMLIPGGYSPDYLRADERFVDFVKQFDATGRPLAAVCHGPQLLLTAGLVGGRTLTAWPTIQGDLRYAGAEVRDESVVVDGNWITSRKPDDLDLFSGRFIQALADLEQHGNWQPVLV